MQRYSGAFIDDSTGTEFVFSGDPHTHQLIRVFDATGAKLTDVPLSDVLDSLGELDSFTMTGPDSFFAQQVHGPRVALFATDGRVLQAWSLEGSLCDNAGDRYALSGSSNGPTYHKGTVYMETDWLGPCVSQVDSRRRSLEATHREYFRHATRKCKVAAVDLDDRKTVRFGACDILTHLADTPRCTIGGVLRVYAAGRLFAISSYSSHVLQIDRNSLSVTDQYPLTFIGGTPAIHPPPISAEDIQEQGYNKRLTTEPKIAAFNYDESSQRFLAIVYHRSDGKGAVEDHIAARAFSILVLDSTMRVVSERQFAQGQYSANVLLKVSGRSWLLVGNHGPRNVQKPKVFHQIQVST